LLRGRLFFFLLSALLLLPGAGWLQAQAPAPSVTGSQPATVRNRTVYDGNWWLKADPLKREGFLDGVADYLVAVNRVRWLRGSTVYALEKIQAYYSRDPRDRSILVPDAWRRVLTESPPPPPLPGGEVYEGPHGYYDGTWYLMGDPDERRGYLEAYLWCLRTYGKQPAAAYPRSLDYYDERIWNYIQMQKAYYEPVADILARFRSAVPN
jgi:hypothetical protein